MGFRTPTDISALTAPPSSGGLQIVAPDMAANALFALGVIDTTGNAGQLIQLDHHGDQTAGYALEIINRPAAKAGVAIHQYSSADPAVIVDNTDSQTAIIVRNTENSQRNPGHHGTGVYLDIYDYLTRSTFNDGVVSGTNLQSNACTFVAASAGKTIVVNGTTTTVTAFIDVHNVTLASAVGDGSALTFSIAQLSNVGVFYSLQNLPSPTGVPNLLFKGKSGGGATFTTDNTGGVPLAVSNASGSNVQAFTIIQAAAQNAMRVTHSGAKEAVVISASGNNNLYTQIVTTTQNYGQQLVTTTDSGMVLSVEKNGTGAGVATQIINKGTGLSLDVRSASASLWGLTSAGLPKWVAAGNVQTTVGAAGAASALPASPSKYLKVVGDDGVTYVIPAYLAA